MTRPKQGFVREKKTFVSGLYFWDNLATKSHSWFLFPDAAPDAAVSVEKHRSGALLQQNNLHFVYNQQLLFVQGFVHMHLHCFFYR